MANDETQDREREKAMEAHEKNIQVLFRQQGDAVRRG
jgi:hypothetical protein